ncbi:hypothetical protein [Bacillus badius]
MCVARCKNVPLEKHHIHTFKSLKGKKRWG